MEKTTIDKKDAQLLSRGKCSTQSITPSIAEIVALQSTEGFWK
jgi:hypothetical protein